MSKWVEIRNIIASKKKEKGASYTADTLLYKDTETLQCDVQILFTVPLKWAKRWCKKAGYQSLKEFDENYTWDDSYEMYISALDKNKVIRTEETTLHQRGI